MRGRLLAPTAVGAREVAVTPARSSKANRRRHLVGYISAGLVVAGNTSRLALFTDYYLVTTIFLCFEVCLLALL